MMHIMIVVSCLDLHLVMFAYAAHSPAACHGTSTLLFHFLHVSFDLVSDLGCYCMNTLGRLLSGAPTLLYWPAKFPVTSH